MERRTLCGVCYGLGALEFNVDFDDETCRMILQSSTLGVMKAHHLEPQQQQQQKRGVVGGDEECF